MRSIEEKSQHLKRKHFRMPKYERDRMRKIRADPGYREAERLRDRERMKSLRSDPKFRAAERDRLRERMRKNREDPAFRAAEREKNRLRMRKVRSNPAFRKKENERHKQRMKKRREDPSFSSLDKEEYGEKENDDDKLDPPPLESEIYNSVNRESESEAYGSEKEYLDQSPEEIVSKEDMVELVSQSNEGSFI